MRVLVIEDEPGIANFIRDGLSEEGFSVDVSEDGTKGSVFALENEYDIVLLDWMLPGLSGIEVLRKIRKEKPSLPVIMLTAKDTVQDTVFGLESGANDYIKKPFAFAELLDRLEDVVQREKQFTADASHELRTPLSIIKGTLEVLNRKPREVEQYIEKIDYVIGEVDRVSSLIDSLLELARLESGKVAPDIVMFDISGMTQGIAERFHASARSRKMELDLHLPEGLEVNADPSMCDIMISNIISNAIKYSLEGDKIEIKTGTRSGVVFCSITDHGAGIDEEHIQKIFDRFYRADSSRGAKTGGKGLGLSITKKLADLQNVTLELSSTPGKETVFTLLFPATS